MRVKHGDQWLEVEPDKPLMIELSPNDRANIIGMAPGATRYAIFHDADRFDREAREKWMDEGADLRSYEGLTTLDNLLDEDGINEEVTKRATERVEALKGDPTA